MTPRFGTRTAGRILAGAGIALALSFGALPAATATAGAPTPMRDGYWTCDEYYTDDGTCAHWTWIWQYQWVCTVYNWDGSCAYSQTQAY
ncbi:hypothetical protein ACIP5Y_44475 [Nocardia sp. NPDC088792]|uniref:hypothetical protein n=1 Tax=Nocardia sp. NPDC088792 TaxID=3364332 RepID=UPI003826D262